MLTVQFSLCAFCVLSKKNTTKLPNKYLMSLRGDRIKKHFPPFSHKNAKIQLITQRTIFCYTFLLHRCLHICCQVEKKRKVKLSNVLSRQISLECTSYIFPRRNEMLRSDCCSLLKLHMDSSFKSPCFSTMLDRQESRWSITVVWDTFAFTIW